jgi:hypothetical protein
MALLGVYGNLQTERRQYPCRWKCRIGLPGSPEEGYRVKSHTKCAIDALKSEMEPAKKDFHENIQLIRRYAYAKN